MPETTWYCVIRCGTYRMVYLGINADEAKAAAGPDCFSAQALTPGEAQRAAAMGAGKLTQHLRILDADRWHPAAEDEPAQILAPDRNFKSSGQNRPFGQNQPGRASS